MSVRVAGDCDLIDVANGGVGCAPDQNRIGIVILKGEAPITCRYPRHCAETNAGIVVSKRVKYLRPRHPAALSCGCIRRPTSRRCPPGERASDGGKSEKQGCRDSAMFLFRWNRRRGKHCLVHTGSLLGCGGDCFPIYKRIRGRMLRQILPLARFAFSRRSLLERKLVDFDQPIPNAAVGPFHDCGVATGRYRDENGRFEIVTRSKADVLENGSLAVSPVVIAPDGRSVSVVNFQERIGQRIWNTKGAE